MTRACVVCGTLFEAKTDRAKYCCKKCADHSRYKRTREEIRRDNDILSEEIRKLYTKGLNDRQIAEKVGFSTHKIRKIRIVLGFPKQLGIRQQQILDLRNKGMCCVEIAERLGIDRKYIKKTAAKIGVPFTDEEKTRSRDLGKQKALKTQWGTLEERIERTNEYIRVNRPEWEYVSGDTIGSDGKIKVKHLICGGISEFAACSIRGTNFKPLTCSHCEAIERAKRKKQREAQLKIIRIRKLEQKQAEKITRFWNQDFKQIKLRECSECGAVFYKNKKYCSVECQERSRNRRHKDKRLMVIGHRLVDKDINLDKLYERDCGICWLCGEICDYSDCETDIKGNFIVGKRYPSIDHVLPLSKGGVHSWDNVKLAHHYCNTLKKNTVVDL